MAGLWIDQNGPVLANTVYNEGKLVAKDVSFTLPSVTPLTSDFRAMGTLTLPLLGQIEAMESSITKIGVDHGLSGLVKMEAKTLEFRFVQDVRTSDASSIQRGCKAFLRVIPKNIPGLTIDPGNISENELTFAVTRYQLFINGQEQWLIDQLNQILRIAGKDYYNDIRSLL